MLVSASIPGCIASTDVEDVADLAGLWVASNAIYSELADPTNRFDLIAEGFAVTMEIEPNGDWVLLLVAGDLASFQTGTMAVDGKLLLITDETGTNTGRAYLEGEQVAIQIEGGLQAWDFDGDGEAEPAKLNLVMDRQP
jgi:hypothetical protein